MVNTNSTALITRIYKSRKNVLELMDKQGFNTSEYSNFSINEINAMTQNNQLDMILTEKPTNTENNNEATSSSTKKCYISYYLNKTLRSNNINDIVDDLIVITETLTKNDIIYIIIKDNIIETIIKHLQNIWEKDGIFVVVENIKCLQFNILKHVLVPEHIIISDIEVQNVMKKYNIADKSLFPEISRFDPVARAISIRPGQICKIIRPSKTAIQSVYYRMCVNI